MIAKSLKHFKADPDHLPTTGIKKVEYNEDLNQVYFDVDIVETNRATLSIRIIVTRTKKRMFFTNSFALCDGKGVLKVHDVVTVPGPMPVLDPTLCLAYAADFIAVHMIAMGRYRFVKDNWEEMLYDIMEAATNALPDKEKK